MLSQRKRGTIWLHSWERRNVKRGQVWLFDCGMAEEVRPVLVLSIPFAETDRAVVTVVFHSTSLRGSEFEVRIQVPCLKERAFIAPSLATYPVARAIRRLGALNPGKLGAVEARVFQWLGRAG